MQALDQERIIQQLKQKNYTKITVKHWTPEFRQDLCDFLEQQGFKDYEFYRTIENDDGNQYVITIHHTYPPYQLEKIYSKKRSFGLKALPLGIATTCIMFTVLIASHSKSLMSAVIVMGVPIILGMLFEYFSNLNKPASLTGMLKTTFIIFVMILIFGIVVLGEGVICLIILSPFAFIFAGIGVLIMRLICDHLWRPTVKIYSLATLPLIVWLTLPEFGQAYYGQTQRSMIIHAPQQQVFQAINHIGKIQPEEVKDSFIFNMGFPKPVFGMTEQREGQIIRTIEWERGVKFEEVVIANQPPHLLSWTYQFSPESFPKGSMDDHVEVGGKYFDLLKTDYQLHKIDDKTTKLTLTIDYRVSTEYNWYSKIWANYVLNEFSDVVMTIHKQRLEKKI